MLTRQYAQATKNSERIYVLSSLADWVLQLAYPAGDFLSDLFGDTDSPWRGALGRKGPPDKTLKNFPKIIHNPIPKSEDCKHADYLHNGGQWERVALPR